MATEGSLELSNTTVLNLYTYNTSKGVTMLLIILDVGAVVVFRVFNILLSTFVIGVISLMGLMSNIATIVVLSHQVNKSINIVFLGLAISGLCVNILSVWYSVTCGIKETTPPNFPFEPLSFIVMTAIIPKTFFVNSSCWLTALMAIIRCLCVVLPFKVGVLFTPRRTAFLTFGLFFFVIFCYSTAYFRNEFVLVSFPEVNASLYIAVELSKGEVIDNTVYYLGFVAVPLINMLIIIFCTLVMVIRVRASVNWRNNAQHGKSFSKEKQLVFVSGRESSTKERRLTKMVVTLTTVFIVCNMPNNLAYVHP
ncbi:uncharacterized protein LOC129923171 [Biomphalaria glabrata]|uniref:Uncharacterized protein LOC129923171 n=1 Tax=Biomphalaria glabrata TaxID=6526 RepID=A0A9W2Z2A7_BIOGL|nr:uncharacterized protein LOC129923171 [Biomphalaria glabrata]